MAHTFPAEEMPDAERARRAADWVDAGIQDLKRAMELAAGRVVEKNIHNLLSGARQLAESIRSHAASMLPTPKEWPMASAKTTRKPRPKRGRQLRIEGLEPESIPELDQAAETYHARKLERCEMSKEEDQAKDSLIDKMKAHGKSRYETAEGLVVEVTDAGEGSDGDE